MVTAQPFNNITALTGTWATHRGQVVTGSVSLHSTHTYLRGIIPVSAEEWSQILISPNYTLLDN